MCIALMTLNTKNIAKQNQENNRLQNETQSRFNLIEFDISKPLLENDHLIVEVLKRIGRATRNELAKLCRLPRTTTYDAIRRLELKNLVGRHIAPRTTRGRPIVFYSLSVEAKFLLV